MAFKMIFYKILLVFTLWFTSISLIAQMPYAEILNNSEDICESNNIVLSIKFHGEAPFGIRYKIGTTTYTVDGQGTNIIKTEDLSSGNVWQSPQTIPMSIPQGEASHSTNVEILHVWDNTVDLPWTDSFGTEIEDQSITYTSYKMPVPHAGNDIDSCGLLAVLNATPDPISSTFYWQDPLAGGLSKQDDPKAEFTGPAEGTYQLTLIQDNGACQALDQVEINLKGSPSGTISTTSEVCGDNPQAVTLDFQFTGNGPWNYTFTDGQNTFNSHSDNLNTSETLQVNGETTFSIGWIKDVNGCRAKAGQIKGSASIIDLKPSPDAGNDKAICGQEIILGATPGSYNGVWSGPSGVTFDDAGNPNATVSAGGYGNYTLTWTETNNGCSASDEINVRFDQSPTPVNAGNDITLYHLFETVLSPVEPTAGKGTWSLFSGSGELSDNSINRPKVTNLEFGTTKLLWTVANGLCQPIIDTLVIEVKGVTYYNGFSPNGDGLNDCFKIMGAGQIPDNEIVVFTQHGKVVYRKKNLAEDGWDGKNLNGKSLNDGIYYFVFTGSTIEPIKDYVLIKTK